MDVKKGMEKSTPVDAFDEDAVDSYRGSILSESPSSPGYATLQDDIYKYDFQTNYMTLENGRL